mmetsp:Transcript_33525/g.54799  ORF Transcript_33525/g.54799 Transcript_33525/m.54799 type:complete len:505 (-) Transcript_33525:133-1647(-)
MFNRLRASITGVEPSSSSLEKSPQLSRRPQIHKDAQTATTTPQQQRAPGFLPPFFSTSTSSLNNNGSESRAAAGAYAPTQERSSFFGGSTSAAAPPQAQERSFFGGLRPQASPKPGEASPRTIRASASALLKLATPPLSNEHPEINPNSTLNDGIDDVDLAQRDTLEHQINRRDHYLSRLQHDLQRMSTQLGQYQKDHATLRRQQLESTHRHGIAIKLWRRTNDGLRARVDCFESETTPAAAREIANLIRDAAPPNKDSAYLMMLQDQLTKANVKLDHLGSQTEIVLHKGEEVVESLREEMNEVIRERCRMELELLDQERMLEDDMRRMVLKTERRLKRVQGEIDFLEKNAVEVLKSQEEEDDEESLEGGEGERDVEEVDKSEEQEGVGDAKENGEKDEEEDFAEDEEGEGDESSDGSDSSEESNDDEQNKPSSDNKDKLSKDSEATTKPSNNAPPTKKRTHPRSPPKRTPTSRHGTGSVPLRPPKEIARKERGIPQSDAVKGE